MKERNITEKEKDIQKKKEKDNERKGYNNRGRKGQIEKER